MLIFLAAHWLLIAILGLLAIAAAGVLFVAVWDADIFADQFFGSGPS